MISKNSLQKEEIRTIIKEELSYMFPELEIVSNSDLSQREIKLCELAEEEYRNNKTKSFDEVYQKLMNK